MCVFCNSKPFVRSEPPNINNRSANRSGANNPTVGRRNNHK